jgi:hypothetical protein
MLFLLFIFLVIGLFAFITCNEDNVNINIKRCVEKFKDPYNIIYGPLMILASMAIITIMVIGGIVGILAGLVYLIVYGIAISFIVLPIVIAETLDDYRKQQGDKNEQ